jgi:hypothetical protein
MQKLFVVLFAAAVAFAGPKVGARVGYYGTVNPFTGQDTDGPAFGGQIVLPMAGLFDLEFSGTYASSKSDIVMSDYLVNYVNNEYGIDFSNNPEGLRTYLQSQWGWSDPAMLDETFESTYHDLGLAAILKLGIPLGGSPLKPYVGGGMGVHFTASDADALLAAIETQTQGSTTIDPYDHIHPAMMGVVGLSFSPPLLPLSFFGEFNYAKPMGDEAGDAINSFQLGVNFGF